ncbi:hypothetical protein ANN_14758, partial [Periplaneta americana]
MAGLCEGGNEPPSSLKASKCRHQDVVGSEGALTVSSAAEEAGTAEFVKSEPA